MDIQDSSKPVGRTGWDLLASSRFFILACLVLVLLAVVAVAKPDIMQLIADAVNSIMDALEPYLLPAIAGAILAHYIYDNFVSQYVLVLVWDGSNGVVGCCAFTRTSFTVWTKNNGPTQLLATSFGSPIYLARSIDYQERTIDFGYIHDAEHNPLEIFSHLKNYHSLIELLSSLKLQVVKLTSMRTVDGLDFAAELIESEHSQLKAVMGVKEEVPSDDN